MPTPRKIRCTVTRVVAHGEQVYTVQLVPERPAPGFRPGQFLHLALDEYDPSSFWPESRAFSLASSPQARETLEILYAVKGRYTSRMASELAEGRKVWVKLPYGDFAIRDDAASVVLFAGGTGISAFTAFLREMHSVPRRSVYLLYGARTPGLLVCRDLVLDRVGAVPDFHAVMVAQTAAPAIPDHLAGLPNAPVAAEGVLSPGLVWDRLPDPLGSMFHLSGPPAMIAALRHDLGARDVPPQSIRIDAWD